MFTWSERWDMLSLLGWSTSDPQTEGTFVPDPGTPLYCITHPGCRVQSLNSNTAHPDQLPQLSPHWLLDEIAF